MNKRFSFICLILIGLLIGAHTPRIHAMHAADPQAVAIPNGFRHLNQYPSFNMIMPDDHQARLDLEEMERRIQATYSDVDNMENQEKAKHMTFVRDAFAQYAGTLFETQNFTDDTVTTTLNAALDVFLRLVLESDYETYFGAFIFNQFTSLPVFYNRPAAEHPLILNLMVQSVYNIYVDIADDDSDDSEYSSSDDEENPLPQYNWAETPPTEAEEDDNEASLMALDWQNVFDTAKEIQAKLAFDSFNALFRGVPLTFTTEEAAVDATQFAGYLHEIFDYIDNTGTFLPPTFINQMRSTLNMGNERPFTPEDAYRLEQALRQSYAVDMNAPLN